MKSFNIRVRHLSKNYGTNRIFGDVSFTHPKGVLGIAGPNGSGKSTLLQCLAGLKQPSSGTIQWKKENGTFSNKSLKAHLGYAAPYINLYNELSCTENLNFLLRLRGKIKNSSVIKKILEHMDIASFASNLYGNLSTGQQQRLRLASALVHQPGILFLDEPGANLDERGRALIESIVSEFRETDRLVILASNNPGELELCDKVYSVRTEEFI